MYSLVTPFVFSRHVQFCKLPCDQGALLGWGATRDTQLTTNSESPQLLLSTKRGFILKIILRIIVSESEMAANDPWAIPLGNDPLPTEVWDKMLLQVFFLVFNLWAVGGAPEMLDAFGSLLWNAEVCLRINTLLLLWKDTGLLKLGVELEAVTLPEMKPISLLSWSRCCAQLWPHLCCKKAKGSIPNFPAE